jgi:hypothetical protein
MKLPALFGLVLLPILLSAERVEPPFKDASFIGVGSQPLGVQLDSDYSFEQSSQSASYFAPISEFGSERIRPSSAQDLENAVIKEHLNRFASVVEPVFNIHDINPTIVRNISGHPWLMESNVQIPDVQTCRPVLSKIVPLAQGIFCGSGTAGCSVTQQITKRQTYETSSGLMTSSSVSAGINIRFASVDTTFTNERTWVETWGTESETSTAYTFDLNPGSFCTPSMIHVELECSVSSGLYWWDSVLYDSFGILVPEPAFGSNRREPNMRYGDQWCMSAFVRGDLWTSTAGRAELWQPIFPGAPIRGSAYIGVNGNLDGFLSFNPRPFDRDELIIRRDIERISDEWDQNWIFRCSPSRPARSDQIMRIPVRGPNGVLQGFVGCV